MEDKRTLSPAIKDHYKLINIEPGEVILSSGEVVDFRTITLERAKKLHEKGYKNLVPQKTQKPVEDTTAKRKDS